MMDNSNNQKLARHFEFSKGLIKENDVYSKQSLYKLANCYLWMNKFIEAKEYYTQSAIAMFILPKSWKDTGQTDWLVNVCVLAGRSDLYSRVVKELVLCKSIDIGTYPIFYYSMCVMDFLGVQKNGPMWIAKLLEKTKIKETFYMGEAFQAILDKNETNLNLALTNLLIKHQGRAKHGDLRETAEGLICIPAMTIGYIGLLNNMHITVESEYFSGRYLEFLLKSSKQ